MPHPGSRHPQARSMALKGNGFMAVILAAEGAASWRRGGTIQHLDSRAEKRYSEQRHLFGARRRKPYWHIWSDGTSIRHISTVNTYLSYRIRRINVGGHTPVSSAPRNLEILAYAASVPCLSPSLHH